MATTRAANTEIIQSVRDLVETRGVSGAAEALDVSHGTVARVLASLPVSAGTLALIKERLGAAARRNQRQERLAAG